MRALLIAVAACGSTTSQPVTTNHGSADPKPPVELTVTLERTPCMGLCAVYKLTIEPDGHVVFEGNAINNDKPVAQVGRDGLAEIAAKIDAIHFFDYGPDGHIPKPAVCKDVAGGGQQCEMDGVSGCSDTSETIMTVTRAGKVHKVTNAHCEASPLDGLEALIERVAGLPAI